MGTGVWVLEYGYWSIGTGVWVLEYRYWSMGTYNYSYFSCCSQLISLSTNNLKSFVCRTI